MKVEIGPYVEEGERKISVELHNYDTWSMDYTLALIITPMLKQLKATQNGWPCEMEVEEWHEKLDKMIWAFEQKTLDPHWEEQYFFLDENGKVNWDSEGIKKHHLKMLEGFKLFGEHYENLWD